MVNYIFMRLRERAQATEQLIFCGTTREVYMLARCRQQEALDSVDML